MQARDAGPPPPGRAPAPDGPPVADRPIHRDRSARRHRRPRRSQTLPTAAGTLDWFAVTAPGAEALAAREVSHLPDIQDVRAVAGGVSFRGDLTTGFRANLWLRLPTRILLRLGRFRARDFESLRCEAALLPWSELVPRGTPAHFQISQRGSRLYHTGAIAERLEALWSDLIGPRVEPSSPPQRVLVRGVRDVWTVSLDASGERLHRRGWRPETGPASLRETLAAQILALCEWSGDRPLVDALCGVGTFAIEGATLALGRAPGAARPFACELWQGAPLEEWARLRARALAPEPPASLPLIVGIDRDARAVASARRNAERAGCDRCIRFESGPLAALEPPPGPGLVLLNPPYGRRLGRPRELAAQYAELGRTLRTRYRGWRAGVLTPGEKLEAALGLRVRTRHPLRNGGLAIRLSVCDL